MLLTVEVNNNLEDFLNFFFFFVGNPVHAFIVAVHNVFYNFISLFPLCGWFLQKSSLAEDRN